MGAGSLKLSGFSVQCSLSTPFGVDRDPTQKYYTFRVYLMGGVRKRGTLSQEVARYFDVRKNSDNLNSFCKKVDDKATAHT
jgi:hypothetical protein